MKRFAILLLAVAMTGITGLSGCASPAYTVSELNQQIARNWHWEILQIRDDIDYALMVRPIGHLSVWHLR